MPETLEIAPQMNLVSKLEVRNIKQLATFKIDYSKVRVLEYLDKNSRVPKGFREFTGVRLLRLQTQAVPRPAFPSDLLYLQNYSSFHFSKGNILVAVNWDLYPSIKAALDQYVIDLAYDGYYATVYQVKGGSPQQFREFLKVHLPMAGAVLVGSIAVPWFEMDKEDFNGSSSEFPCDLYYMDLNGTWTDVDADGKFGGHTTDVQPEIFVARLWTPAGGGNDAALLNNYFARNHKFRKGLLGYARTGLAFVEPDWTGFGDCALDLMFPAPDIEVVKEAEATGDRFESEVNQQRGWAQICAHSSPFGSAFGPEWVPNTEFSDVNPPNAYFYNLFACSNARFTEPGYMGGWYVFENAGKPICNGMAAVGSTKTGSMLAFENFYGPMASGKSVGEAYKAWWTALGPAHDLGQRQWFYGLTLLGDPTLNWWSGVVPVLRDPGEGDVFDYYPRLTNFRWDPIDIPGVTYTLCVDYFYGTWASEAGTAYTITGLADHNFEHYFVGAQPGRWRVRARVGSIECPWSDWRHFKYTK